MIMVGFVTTEATIRIKHSRRGTQSNGAPHTFFGQRQLTGKWLLHGEMGRRTAKLTLSLLLDGSSFGGPSGAPEDK